MATGPAHAGGFTTTLSNIRPSNGVGHGNEFYPGEGSLVTGGEYHNALEPFLGPPSKAIDYEPSQRFPHEAWFLPDAYAGHNDYVRQTIVDIVINYNSFVTKDILPWREQDNPNIAWDSIKFDKTLIDMEPEQGVPRYVTVEREAHSDYMVRRGLALIVNHGFAATPAGQKDFMYKVATIAGAVQETCDQAGLMALLRSKNEYRHLVVETARDATEAYGLFQHELWRFGIIQHSERGWYHMDAEAQHVMRQENIQPDTWIVPPRMTAYAAMGQHAETEVYRAGEATARGNLERGEDNFSNFRGKRVYETKPYTLDVDGRRIDPLNRTRMIGDFFVVPFWNVHVDANDNVVPEVGGETQVYCCDSDRFETFKWINLMEEAFRGGDGNTGFAAISQFVRDLSKSHKTSKSQEKVSEELKDIAQRHITEFARSGAASGFSRSLGIPMPSFLKAMEAQDRLIVPTTARAMDVDVKDDRVEKLAIAHERLKLQRELETVDQEIAAVEAKNADPHMDADDAEHAAFVERTARENMEARTRKITTEMQTTPQPSPIVPARLAYHAIAAGPVRAALDMGLQQRYNHPQAHTVDHGANTWAKHLVDQGIDKHTAVNAARQALHEVWVRDHLNDGGFTEEWLAEGCYLEPGTNVRRDQQEIVKELHDTWVQGNAPDQGLSLALEASKGRAMEIANAGKQVPSIVAASGVNVDTAETMIAGFKKDIERDGNVLRAQEACASDANIGECRTWNEIRSNPENMFFTKVYTQRELRQLYNSRGGNKCVTRIRVYPGVALAALDDTTRLPAFRDSALALLDTKRREFLQNDEPESYLGRKHDRVNELETIIRTNLEQIKRDLEIIRTEAGCYLYSLKVDKPKADAFRASVKDHACVGNDGLQPVFPNLSDHSTEAGDISRSTYHGGMPEYMACPDHGGFEANDEIGMAFDNCMEILFLAGNRACKELFTFHEQFKKMLNIRPEYGGVRFHSAPSERNHRSMRCKEGIDINMMVPFATWEDNSGPEPPVPGVPTIAERANIRSVGGAGVEIEQNKCIGGVPGVRTADDTHAFRFNKEDHYGIANRSAVDGGIVLPFVSIVGADAIDMAHTVHLPDTRVTKQHERLLSRNEFGMIQDKKLVFPDGTPRPADGYLIDRVRRDGCRLLANVGEEYGGVQLDDVAGLSVNQTQLGPIVGADLSEEVNLIGYVKHDFLEPAVDPDVKLYGAQNTAVANQFVANANTTRDNVIAIPDNGTCTMKVSTNSVTLSNFDRLTEDRYPAYNYVRFGDPRGAGIPEYSITGFLPAHKACVQEDLPGSSGCQTKLPYDNKNMFYKRQLASRVTQEKLIDTATGDTMWSRGPPIEQHMSVAKYNESATAGCHTPTKRQNAYTVDTPRDMTGFHGHGCTTQRVLTLNAADKVQTTFWSQQSTQDITNDEITFSSNVLKMASGMHVADSNRPNWEFYQTLAKPYKHLSTQQRGVVDEFIQDTEQSDANRSLGKIDGSRGYMHRMHIGMFDRPSLPALFSRLNVFNRVVSLVNFDVNNPRKAVIQTSAHMSIPRGISAVGSLYRAQTAHGAYARRAQLVQELNSVSQGGGSGVDDTHYLVDPSNVAYDILCVRPFRQYTMGTGVLLKRGSELGNTFRGWADFQLTDNIIAKTHIGHFTFWHASVVTNPKMLFLAEDIFCTNYIGGEGNKVLPYSAIPDFREDPLGTMQQHRASIICLPVPVGAINPHDKRLNTNNPISLTGRLNPHTREMAGQQDAHHVHIGDYMCDSRGPDISRHMQDAYHLAHGKMSTLGPHTPAADQLCGQDYSHVYDQIFGFSGMNHEVDYENSRTYETSARLINTMCFHTMQKFRNPKTNRWEVTNLNTGHFGENGIYEGVKKIRCGFIEYFKEMEYQKAMAFGGLGI